MNKKTVWLVKVLAFLVSYHLSLTISTAQPQRAVRGDCTPVFTEAGNATRSPGIRRLPAVSNNWDSSRTYHQLVILMSFTDTDFNMEKPRETYDSIFNVVGYNQRQGAGCVADYFRAQSGGMLKLQFDVFGPYKLESKAQPYENPTETTRNYGRDQMVAATKLFLAENPDLDFSQYDWNGNGQVNQVIYVYAGYCGNQSSQKCYGHIWPNTSSFTTINTPDGKSIADYTASGELWANGTSCGIGTVCHEFSHSLGLPDIYPTSADAGYSMVDEWDLMDGGNFTNYGWCPPNYSPLEKMLLGWLTPSELDVPTTIESLRPQAEGGQVFIVKHTKDEYLLLENRQWSGWDKGLPGRGLVAYHVNYDANRWRGNTVNNVKGKPYYSIFHADNLGYDEWEQMLYDRGVTSQNAVYQNNFRMNSSLLSSSAYPWRTDSTFTVNSELTDESVPATVMYNANASSLNLLSKPITNITQNPDGTISFLFMGGGAEGIQQQYADDYFQIVCDLSGRQTTAGTSRKGIFIEKSRTGRIQKVVK